MSIASADQEASTAAVTRSCFEKFQQCLQQTDGKTKIHVQTRLADLRLWADSVGAVAHEKASLDYRFQHRLDAIFFIRNLLSMLEGFLKDMEECFLTAKHEADLQDIMTNIDSTIDTLAFIGVQIRRSGRKSRIRKADNSFDQNQDRYRNLRAHLACVVLARPTEEGRPKDEGKDIHSVDYFAKMKLSPIQDRLIEANLRRRHRFEEAQRHSGRLKDHSGNVAPPVIPQQFIAISTTQHAKQDISPLQDKKIAAVMRQQSSRPGPQKEDTHTIAPTSATGLDSKWGGLQEKRRPGPTATRLTSTTAKMRYPRAHKLSDAEQKLAKCPCCCQAIPATELEGSRWRKHVANDLGPYTCVVTNCPTPYNLFVTQEEWNDHVINDHPPHWQCPCCGDPPIFESISGITHHLMTEHPDEVEADLEFLSDAEINIMGITNCPLCDSEGPQDSLDLMEHVLQHVHDFSLRSLPWPADLPITLDKSAGLFDMSHAVKIVKDKEGNVFKHDIATWAEHVVPTFDQSRGVLICYDKEGKELILSAASTLEAAERRTSLQLRDVDRNTLKNEEESTQQDASRQDYFSQFGNDYFVDESSDGRFPQTYHLPPQSGATERSTENHEPKRWICPICHAQSKPESSGEKDFFEHLIPSHPVEQAEIDSSGGKDRWMRYMLAEAYWFGIEADMTGTVEGSEKELDGEDPAALSSVGNLTGVPQYPEFPGSDSDWEESLNPKEFLDAEESLLRELRDIENTLGLDSIAHLDILDRLGVLYKSQGRYDIAEKTFLRALQGREEALGPKHTSTLDTVNNLGVLYKGQGRLDDAERMYNQALRGREEAFGAEHPDTLTSVSQLGTVLSRQGKYEEAEAMHRRALVGSEKVLGAEHPDTLTSMANLASTYRNQGQWKDAEALEEDLGGQTPLWRAAERGHEAVVKLLLEMGKVDVDSKDSDGRTPLSWAAGGGHEAVVKLLLETGKVDVDSKDSYELTPLWRAAERGHEAVVKLLLETGKADVDSKGPAGRTPLSWAAGGGHEAVVKLLLKTGKVDVDSKGPGGRTPLSWAAGGGHEVVVKLLLKTGKVDVDSKDSYEQTPLSWAAERGHEAVVKLLLETGKVDVDSKDSDGRTPLSWAAERGYEAVVKLLLETGKVDVDSKDSGGQTPLSWAARGGHEAVVKLLRSHVNLS